MTLIGSGRMVCAVAIVSAAAIAAEPKPSVAQTTKSRLAVAPVEDTDRSKTPRDSTRPKKAQVAEPRAMGRADSPDTAARADRRALKLKLIQSSRPLGEKVAVVRKAKSADDPFDSDSAVTQRKGPAPDALPAAAMGRAKSPAPDAGPKRKRDKLKLIARDKKRLSN